MTRSVAFLLLFFSCVSLSLGARSNVCLAAGSTVYKPLQLYPSNCPNNASNCMAAVYNYKPSLFLSQGPSTLKPAPRDVYVYMTQDESDNLDVVVIATTSYKNTIINTIIEVIGAVPNNAQVILKDDPTEDTWQWDPVNNKGAFKWLLQPDFTDGVVLGHFKLVNNYCFRTTFLPNWGGALANIIFLSGNVSKPVQVVKKALTGNSTYSNYFEFCQYPQALISKTDASCLHPGTATVTPLNGTGTYLWTKDGQTVGTTQTITGLAAGVYTVLYTSNGCSVTREVNISQTGVVFTGSTAPTSETRTSLGRIDLTLSGGNPPYSIKWYNSAQAVIASNVTSIDVPAGNYSVWVYDGCQSAIYFVVVGGIDRCPAGTRYDVASGCVSCPPGTYSTTLDAAKCTACPVGKWNNVQNATSCLSCPANTYTSGGSDECAACPVNTISVSESGLCTPCPPGSDRAVAATTCSTCAPGSFRCDATAPCAACLAGSFGVAGGKCELCSPGTYQNTPGQTSCLGCPANSYAAAGASGCSACPSGTHSLAGSTVLLACV